ncbi:liprin-alpha-1-like [Bos indicus x Bos taurus]|uniref:liprin-alpha-1-like n=1 Tax=Bos indicus x Bos taurus TaxID=30522 RepID=UPI000F7D36BD|nr:liprin-alpha-1-like [Bos indicus x Bos taurus]
MVKKMELQEIIERQLREQSQMEERLAALSAHVKHLEEDLDTARKDLLKSKNMNRKLEQDIRETEDKNRQLQERLELVEKLQQRLRRAETLPEVEAEQAQRVASLSKDQLILNLETLRAEVDQTRLRGAPFHHSRPHLGSAPDLRFPVADRPADSLGNGAVLRCPQKGRLAALHDEPSEARTPPPPSHPWWAPCEAPAPSHCGPEGGAHNLLAAKWRPGREGDRRGHSQGAFRDPQWALQGALEEESAGTPCAIGRREKGEDMPTGLMGVNP